MKELLKNFIKKNSFKIIVGVSFLYSSFQGVINFFRGYHNLDIAFNFLNLGYTNDMTLNLGSVSLISAYRDGLSLMLSSVGWLCFSIILSFVFGYLIKQNER